MEAARIHSNKGFEYIQDISIHQKRRLFQIDMVGTLNFEKMFLVQRLDLANICRLSNRYKLVHELRTFPLRIHNSLRFESIGIILVNRIAVFD